MFSSSRDDKDDKKKIFPSSTSGSESIGTLFLPAQTLLPTYFSKNYPGFSVNETNVPSSDKVLLQTLEIAANADLELPKDQRYYVVKFNGNYSQVQPQVANFVAEAEKLKVTVIGFNYRGVSNSTTPKPKVFNDLVEDGIFQIRRLLHQGVPAKNITLDGLSLGGAIAIRVAAYFHDNKQRVYLWADRTLGCLTSAAAGMVAPNLAPVVDDIAYTSTFSSVASITMATGWDSNIAKAYLSIPAEYRSYMTVAKKSDKTHSNGDGVIAERALLHNHVKAAEKSAGTRTGHTVLNPKLWGGGHNASRRDLFSKKDPQISAQQLFENFVLSHRR